MAREEDELSSESDLPLSALAIIAIEEEQTASKQQNQANIGHNLETIGRALVFEVAHFTSLWLRTVYRRPLVEAIMRRNAPETSFLVE